MISKKKRHFWQLSFIFISITIVSLLYNWQYKSNLQSSMSMMTQSMGNMMSSMHLQNIKLEDLFKQEKESVENVNASHHDSQDPKLKRVHYFTTIIIIVLIPFIVAGSIFLAIVWIE